MKDITMLITNWCPHCKKAINWIDEIKKEHPEYRDVKVDIIDEEKKPDIAKQYDYYYVPTYFVGNNKIYEGATTKEIIFKAFEEASK
jgi:Glutaredoxin and related proteins